MELARRVSRLRRTKSLLEVKKEFGLSVYRISNFDRIITKSRESWLTWVEEGLLSLKHLEAVLNLPPHRAEALLRSAMQHKWSTRVLRDEVRYERGEPRPDQEHADADLARLERSLSEQLGTSVRIRMKGREGSWCSASPTTTPWKDCLSG